MSFPGRTPMFSTRTLYRGGDESELARTVKAALEPYTLRFTGPRGTTGAWLAVARLSDVSLCHIHPGAGAVLSRPESADMADLYFASEPGTVLTSAGEASLLTPGVPLAVSTEAGVDIELTAQANLFIVRLPHRRLISQLEMLTGQKVSRGVIFNDAPDPHAPLVQALTGTLQFLCEHLEQGDTDAVPSMMHETFLEAIAGFLLVGWDNNYRDMIFRGFSPAAPKYVYRAEEYMVRHVDRQVTMEELVALTGVSSRSLQYGFRRFRNTTPMKWLRDRRLDEARHQLLYEDDDMSIQEVALKWGFPNHPHFSRAYRERFGESPQRTRSSRQKRKG